MLVENSEFEEAVFSLEWGGKKADQQMNEMRLTAETWKEIEKALGH